MLKTDADLTPIPIGPGLEKELKLTTHELSTQPASARPSPRAFRESTWRYLGRERAVCRSHTRTISPIAINSCSHLGMLGICSGAKVPGG